MPKEVGSSKRSSATAPKTRSLDHVPGLAVRAATAGEAPLDRGTGLLNPVTVIERTVIEKEADQGANKDSNNQGVSQGAGGQGTVQGAAQADDRGDDRDDDDQDDAGDDLDD